MSKRKRGWDPIKFQKRCMAVLAVVLCLSLVLSMLAYTLAY
ncbi:MAG: hypothetical protein SOR61_07840 [Evtepia sp.]|nr:hypothetical protein [Evtepia sp.]MDY3015074.1 hypothetical protein [Evtepia sp.]